MSNSEEVLREMSRRCAGKNSQCSRPTGGKHTQCQGGICKDMAKYPRELCRAVLRGISTQLKADGRNLSGCYGVQVADDASDMKQLFGPEQGYSGRFKDDLTGQTLRDDLVVRKNWSSSLARACGSRCQDRELSSAPVDRLSRSAGWMSTRVTTSSPMYGLDSSPGNSKPWTHPGRHTSLQRHLWRRSARS